MKRKVGLCAVYDLSATPFFLSGSGYREGSLFPWVVSDFSLLDAIECGIVKLPRVPVDDNLPSGDMPIYRNLWQVLKERGRSLPRKGASKAGDLDPLNLAAGASDRALFPLLALQADIRAVVAGHPRAAGLHRRLQQHGGVEARLRVDFRLPAQE